MPVRESASTRNTFATASSVAAAILLTVGLSAGCAKTDDNSANIVRTTTNIAGAAVVGIERDTSKACPLPSSPDAVSGTRSVTHAAGTSEVPADPKRIVVLSTAALDATCALGLWERVVGATTVAGPTPQPSYLGTGVDVIPAVGAADSPDPAKIAELKPDLIIGPATDNNRYGALQAIAPTVLVGDDNGWQATFTGFAEAMDRKNAGTQALADYRAAAKDAGNAVQASLTQASVIRFDPNQIQVQGGNSFAGQVLGDAGVQRPAAQRGDSFDVTTLSAESDRNKLEGDIIFLSFAGADGLEYGKSVMTADDWKKLACVSDRREFAVDDTIWHGNGLTAARALLDDMRLNLNGYVTD
ncbi:iron-siderophore ABC transporter substrate-binding protein [Nocardia yunnanensis]|uniref:Iron-siderophore ABC transporter substrate-binding protein n=1 Tax=Nocardia yunnanensis TaxID=2382165 RepID=A0A386Z8Q6_9NOCA|nr:iron-siderophore ABC transporter substrate-binding protein [Nocardia yunnanensis]AYF73998.1 iron-siderophore ABC transporter substrate-binding protein [Nocardia yunnanensis]